MYKQDVLKNGLKMVTSGMPQMESVSIGIWIGVGARYEKKELCGMSHLIEHMLFKGTTTKTATELKATIEGVGGSFNGFTSEEVTCYLVKLPSRYTELGLDVLSDMVLNPEIDPKELEKEKFVICEEIKMYMDQPAHHVFDILAETMWPNHSLGRPIAGRINTVKSFTREDLIDFKNSYYQPANITIVASGKINRRKCINFAKNVFSAASSKKRFHFDSVKKNHKANAIKLFQKDTKQTHIAFGFHSLSRTHRLRHALSLLNIILGGNMSSRLFERLRERKALCYEISSSVKRYKETGAFVIHAGVDNNKLFEASREIAHELTDLKRNSVMQEELDRAKEYAKGQLLMALEDTATRMLWLGEKIITEGRAPVVKELFKNIEKVTAQDIKNAANIVFNKKNLNFATVGPACQKKKEELARNITL